VRYFFLAYAIAGVLLVGILGLRGDKFSKPPIRLFPDMDEQDKVKAQSVSRFFADGSGGRLPVAGTGPRGFLPGGEREMGGVREPEFGGGEGYYFSGRIGDYYGHGMPAELGLDEQQIGGFLRRGEERFGIYCAVCHGMSGDGKGITSEFGVPVAVNQNANLAALDPDKYPDGRLFSVITDGLGQMGGYGYQIPVRDRWAIIAYIHALRTARQAPYEVVGEAYEQWKSGQAGSRPLTAND
jgi:hypothetical protein